MSFGELAALVSLGYVCGLSIIAGFVLSAVYQFYVKGKSKLRGNLWIVAMVVTMCTTTLAPVFAMALLVFGDDPDGPGFYPRMATFAVATLAGAGFAFGAAHLFNKGVVSRRGL